MHEAKPREDGDENADYISRAWSMNRYNNNTVSMGFFRPTTSALPISWVSARSTTRVCANQRHRLTASTLQRTAPDCMVNEATLANFLLARSSGQPRQRTISFSMT